MVSESQIQYALDALNDALRRDPIAMSAIMGTRHQCNKSLADHPSIQAGAMEGDAHQVGPLGIINGILGIDPVTGYGPISAKIDGCRVLEFSRTPENLFQQVKS